MEEQYNDISTFNFNKFPSKIIDFFSFFQKTPKISLEIK